jgi:DNA-binding transcriptional MerR regulator
MELYQPKQVAKMVGISPASLRNYTARYRRFYSSQATPPPGQPRLFTPADVRLTAYIAQATGAGSTHDEIAAHLEQAQGVPADFEFTPAPTVAPDDTAALVPNAQAQALLQLMARQLEQAQAREQAARDRERELLEQLAQAQRELGQLEGELKAVKAQRRSWLDRLFDRLQGQKRP